MDKKIRDPKSIQFCSVQDNSPPTSSALRSPPSTCPVHRTKIRLVQAHMKKRLNFLLLVVNETGQDVSAYPFKAILLTLFPEVYHSSEVLLPSTDIYT